MAMTVSSRGSPGPAPTSHTSPGARSGNSGKMSGGKFMAAKKVFRPSGSEGASTVVQACGNLGWRRVSMASRFEIAFDLKSCQTKADFRPDASEMSQKLPRLTLVLGGARSGKSRYAEGLITAEPAPWIYVATG